MLTTETPTHIFIVENNKIFVKMLDYVFTKDYSHRFIDFTSCEECVKNLHFNPEIIVLDSELPEYRSVLHKLKKKSPKPHVILLTGGQSINTTADPHTVVDEYLVKQPGSETAINDRIEQVLGRRRNSIDGGQLRVAASGG
jgi:DNA-binding NtrC family response regulator